MSSEATGISRFIVDTSSSDQNPGWCGYFWGLDYPVLPSCIGICLLRHVASLYWSHVLEFTCCGLVCCVASCFFTCTREASAQCCGEVPVHHVISTTFWHLRIGHLFWPTGILIRFSTQVPQHKHFSIWKIWYPRVLRVENDGTPKLDMNGFLTVEKHVEYLSGGSHERAHCHISCHNS